MPSSGSSRAGRPPPRSFGRERRLRPDGVCDPRALDEDGREHVRDIAGIDQRDPVVPRVAAPGWQPALAGVGADHVREYVRVPGIALGVPHLVPGTEPGRLLGFTGNTWYPAAIRAIAHGP